MSHIQRILVIRFSSLGDVILTTPLLRAIKRDLPGAGITFVTKTAYAPILRNNPSVDEIVELNDGQTLGSLARSIRAHGPFDVSLDLHVNLRSLALRRLLGGKWSSYDKHRLRRRLLISLGIDAYPAHSTVTRAYCEAATCIGVEPDPGPPEVFPDASAVRSIPGSVSDSTIVLAPGARHETKRWPAQHWTQLYHELDLRGHHVLALGQQAEREFLAGSGIPGLFDLPLEVAAATIQRARMVIANDSGLMHLATSVGTPVVAFFGPTVRQFGFYPHPARGQVLERAMPCRPCSPSGSKYCPLGHHQCLAAIEPEAVLSCIEAA